MNRVPRLSARLRIERSDGGQYRVLDPAGGELFRLTEGGYRLLCAMDGVRSLEDVLLDHGVATGAQLGRDEAEAWIGELRAAGVLVEDARAAQALGHLADEGVNFRLPRVDRREAERPGPRRDPASDVLPWFDHAVFLLNDGKLEESLEVFQRMASALPSDVRLAELALHLESFLSTEQRGEVDRRDVSWAAFDATLREMLADGRCPRCEAPIEVTLGGVNRCGACGAGFSAWVLEQSRTERRGG